MKRVGILTAGGDTPALNATIFGAVTRANAMGVEVVGIIKGFGGLLDTRCPSIELNPLLITIPNSIPASGEHCWGPRERTSTVTTAKRSTRRREGWNG